MPFGMEVDLRQGDIVLDEDPALPSPQKRAQHPQFWPMYCGQMAALIKMPLVSQYGRTSEIVFCPSDKWTELILPITFGDPSYSKLPRLLFLHLPSCTAVR